MALNVGGELVTSVQIHIAFDHQHVGGIFAAKTQQLSKMIYNDNNDSKNKN